MASTVKIFLDNYVNNTCYPGQTLAGRVECFFNTEKTVRGIRLKFKGRAKTKWTNRHGKSSTTYSSEEFYFNQEFNLISGAADEVQLEAGRHTYPFSYILPQTLPSSFEGKHGKVRYTIKATVDRPWKTDYEEKVILNVCSPLDLNSLPGLNEPYAVSLEKEVSSGCCFCQSEPMTFNLSLPARGYAEGQDMNIGAFVGNMSNVNVMCVVFKIIQTIKYLASSWANESEKYKEFPVASCTTGAIGAHAEKAWTSTLIIPRSNFPNLTACRIINATYRVEAVVVLPSPHSNLEFAFPITIGTVPLSGINMGLVGPPPETNSNTTALPAASFAAGESFEDIASLPNANITYSPKTVSVLM